MNSTLLPFRWVPAVVLSLALTTLTRTPDSAFQHPDTAPQDSNSAQSRSGSSDQDPLTRPLKPGRQGKSQREKTSSYQKKWADEVVKYIITDEELSAWKKLGTNAERDNFIEAFWQRRNPDPDSPENAFREEHYRRMAYANEHFASGVEGWRTDRGRIYIMYGKPDSVDSHPMGGPYQRPPEEGGGQTETYPFEVWTYHHLNGITQQEIQIEFVDTCSCGEYRMTNNPSEKDTLLHVPNAGQTDLEAMNLATKAQRFTNPDNIGPGLFNQNLQSKEFDRQELFAQLNRPPAVNFAGVNESVRSFVHYSLLPFDVQVDFVKMDSATVLVPISVQVPNREVTFVNQDGLQRARLNIFGRLSTVTGRVVATFEEPVTLAIPPELLEKSLNNMALYWHAVSLHPGHYRLDVTVKDINGDKLGSMGQSVVVPEYSSDNLAASSLILSDVMEPVAAREVGSGNFVIGTMKVRPRIAPAPGKPATFKRERDPAVNFWMQVYNLSLDESTGKPSARVDYHVVNVQTRQPVMAFTENTDQMGNVGNRLTLQKSLPLNKLQPGLYQVTITVNDLVSGQVIAPAAAFAVE